MQKATDIHANIVKRMGLTTRSPVFEDGIEVESSLLHDTVSAVEIDTYIDGLISKGVPVHLPLRLLCLQSVCSGGLKQKRLDQVKRDLIQQYGFHLIRGLEALGRVGLLKAYDRTNFVLNAAVRKVCLKPRWSFVTVLKKKIKRELAVVSLNRKKNSRTSIFATLALLLFQFELFRLGISSLFWLFLLFDVRRCKGLLATVPGAERPGDQEYLRVLPGGPPLVQSQQRAVSANSLTAVGGSDKAKSVACVVFVGGCTHAEISALRLLASRDTTREFVIVTTKLGDAKSFLASVLDACIPTPVAMAEEPKQ